MQLMNCLYNAYIIPAKLSKQTLLNKIPTMENGQHQPKVVKCVGNLVKTYNAAYDDLRDEFRSFFIKNINSKSVQSHNDLHIDDDNLKEKLDEFVFLLIVKIDAGLYTYFYTYLYTYLYTVY